MAAAVGDLFVIHDTGAHSHSMGFQYNGKLRAPELLLRSSGPGAGSVQLIRARESLSYLFGNTVLPLDLLQALPAAAASAYPYGRQEAGGRRQWQWQQCCQLCCCCCRQQLHWQCPGCQLCRGCCCSWGRCEEGRGRRCCQGDCSAGCGCCGAAGGEEGVGEMRV